MTFVCLFLFDGVAMNFKWDPYRHDHQPRLTVGRNRSRTVWIVAENDSTITLHMQMNVYDLHVHTYR